jgi:RimJ/RimL family protein N-acetyltransferase
MDGSMNEISLKQIEACDTPWIVHWRNANKEWFPAQPDLTATSHRRWFDETYQCDPSQNVYIVMLNGVGIGMVGMTIKDGKGELERMVLGEKQFARGGYMRTAMRMLMDAYGLEHYWLRVMPHNDRTIAFHKKNGFTVTSTHGGDFASPTGISGEYLVMERWGEPQWDHLQASA